MTGDFLSFGILIGDVIDGLIGGLIGGFIGCLIGSVIGGFFCWGWIVNLQPFLLSFPQPYVCLNFIQLAPILYYSHTGQ